MLDRRAHPRVQQHCFRSRHFRSGPHPARPRHRRRLRSVEDDGREKAEGQGPKRRNEGLRMSLIGRLVEKLLTKGSITLLRPGKQPETFGSGGGKHLTVRFTDRKVGFDIVKNPRLGLGEAYMDGRLIIEAGTILDLLELIVSANRWEAKGHGRAALSRGKRRFNRRLSRTIPFRARATVRHHSDL